jgi:Fe-Mn family superoxide dismutase
MKKLFFLALFCTLGFCSYTAKDYSYLLTLKDFDKELLEMHFKLYSGYVNNTNNVLEQLKKVQKGTQEYFGLKRRLAWEFNGMRLHEYYFGNLGKYVPLKKETALYRQIEKDFGSYNQWENDFIQTGLLRGIGWVVLYFDPIQDRLLNIWIDDHNTGNLTGARPILVMDCWEHAYITQFKLDRKQYISVFLKNINWDITTERFIPLHLSADEDE